MMLGKENLDDVEHKKITQPKHGAKNVLCGRANDVIPTNLPNQSARFRRCPGVPFVKIPNAIFVNFNYSTTECHNSV